MLKILAERLIYLYGRVYLAFEPKTMSWRERIREITKTDPLFCKRCQKNLMLIQINYRIRDGTWKSVPIY